MRPKGEKTVFTLGSDQQIGVQMTINASDRTLGLISIWQVLRKLNWEIELIKAIPDKTTVGAKPDSVLLWQDAKLYATINAASTSLALVDWLYHTVNADSSLMMKIQSSLPGVDMTENKKLLKYLRDHNLAINACHQICNANKHFHLHKPDDKFKVMVGELVFPKEDGTTEVSVITHIMRNQDDPSAATSVLQMIEGVAVWWEKLLADLDMSGREDFFPATSK